jgi:hypothetical protein
MCRMGMGGCIDEGERRVGSPCEKLGGVCRFVGVTGSGMGKSLIRYLVLQQRVSRI